MNRSDELIEAALYSLIEAAISEGQTIATVGSGKPNRVVSISRSGLSIETERSKSKGEGSQSVPGWMFNEGWRQLTDRGSLARNDFVNGAFGQAVKRSAAVFAVLARCEGVEVESTRPCVLRKVV